MLQKFALTLRQQSQKRLPRYKRTSHKDTKNVLNKQIKTSSDMNIQEFETRTGLSVDQKEYAKIEQIYLNAGTMDKDAFCKAWKLAKGATLELIEDLSHAVDGKRIHNGRLDIQIENLQHDLEMAEDMKTELRKTISELREANNELNNERNMLIGEKVDLALALLNAGLDEKAISILGHGYVISLKCSCDIELSHADKKYIAETFGK